MHGRVRGAVRRDVRNERAREPTPRPLMRHAMRRNGGRDETRPSEPSVVAGFGGPRSVVAASRGWYNEKPLFAQNVRARPFGVAQGGEPAEPQAVPLRSTSKRKTDNRREHS